MYILTNNENVIIEISSKYELDEEHRNIIVDNYAIAYGPEEKINVYEVAEVPEEVKENKYCYTEEKGFYANADYVEPINEDNRIKALEEQITEIQLAMVESEV